MMRKLGMRECESPTYSRKRTPQPVGRAGLHFGDGGLTAHESLEAAASYLEPEDIDEPTVI